MRRTAALTSSRDSASGPIRLRRLFADVFGNDVLSQLSLRLRVLRERDDEGRAEIPIVVAPAHPGYGHHWHSWASRWPS
jgi:hypothetical protein